MKAWPLLLAFLAGSALADTPTLTLEAVLSAAEATHPDLDLARARQAAASASEQLATSLNDFEGRATTGKAFALANRARATPTFLFFDLEGKPVARYTGATQTPEEFMLLGQYVVEAAYKTQPFNAYKTRAGKR